MSKSIIRHRAFAGCILALFAIGATALGWPDPVKSPSDAAKSPRSIRVEKCTVLLLKEAKLAFERPGILATLSVQEGDRVEEGRQLAVLKDDVARAGVAVAAATAVAAEVDIGYSESALKVAQTELIKIEEANHKIPGTVPNIEVQRAALTVEKSRFEVEKAKHNKTIAELKRDEAAAQLDTYRLESPFDGFVTRVLLTKGASVKQGDWLIELVSTRKLKVEGVVSLRDASAVHAGDTVSVQLDVPELRGATGAKSYPGRIVFVDVKATPVDPKVRVWAEVDNVDEALRAGLMATMTITPAKGE
jgi:RND family efflux transporter MFP subunit